MNETRARFVLGAAIPVATLAVPVVLYLAVRDQLPSRLATHFDGSGAPDGSMAPGAFLAFTLVMVAVGAAICIWLARSAAPLPASVAPTAGFLGGFLAGLGAGISVGTLVTQRGLQDWTDADGVIMLVVVAVLAGLVMGVGAARAAAVLPASVFVPAAGAQPTMELAEGQHAVWAQTVHSAWLARFGVGVLVVGVVAAVSVDPWIVVPAALLGLIIVSLATLQVRADGAGLHVKYGVVPWPRTHVAVGDIDTATVIDVRPMEWGGWGYRGSLKLMKQAAVVHRAGPGIRLDLRDGKVFVVTVDRPEIAVALLNAEVARLAQPA